jgi:hypothetical protein
VEVAEKGNAAMSVLFAATCCMIFYRPTRSPAKPVM